MREQGCHIGAKMLAVTGRAGLQGTKVCASRILTLIFRKAVLLLVLVWHPPRVLWELTYNGRTSDLRALDANISRRIR
jgi:hypothetical protein